MSPFRVPGRLAFGFLIAEPPRIADRAPPLGWERRTTAIWYTTGIP
jgi:hypothetical protein